MRKKGYVFTDEHRKKISDANKLRPIDPNVEIRRTQARHKICKNCNVEFCSITPTGYRTPKYVCCTKECANSLMTEKRMANNSYMRNEEAIKKCIETRKSKNPNYGDKKKFLLQQREIRGLHKYDKTKYSHWSQAPENKEYLKNISKNKIISDETRRLMSLSRKKLLQENPSLIYSSANGGKRKDLNDFYFRSNWEANYARILNELKIDWEYEKHSFLLSNGTHYTPDFKISDNKFVELKGWFDDDSKVKIELFIKEYPQYELDLIDEEKYYTLRNLFKHKISNWEGR
jgi:hypothetical protein